MRNGSGVISIPLPGGPPFTTAVGMGAVTEVHEVGEEVEDLAVLPSQFADLRRSVGHDGRRMLILAVLVDAIRIWARRNKKPPLARERTTIEVSSWLFDEGDGRPFSFRWICENLSIDAGGLRAQLRRGRASIVLHRRGGIARANKICLGRDKQRRSHVAARPSGLRSFKRSDQRHD